MDALAFLKTTNAKRQPVYALVGDEPFLKRHARERIIAAAIGDEDPAFAVGVYSGDKLDFSTVRNELETLPFLAPCRVVVVDCEGGFRKEGRCRIAGVALHQQPERLIRLRCRVVGDRDCDRLRCLSGCEAELLVQLAGVVTVVRGTFAGLTLTTPASGCASTR